MGRWRQQRPILKQVTHKGDAMAVTGLGEGFRNI